MTRTTGYMEPDFSKRIRAGYITAFLLLLLAYFLSITATHQLERDNAWVSHSRETINKLELLLSYLKDSEIGLRGYMVTKDEKYLLPYYTSKKKVDSVQQLLITATKDNLVQQERLQSLNGLLDKKFRLISKQLSTFRSAGLSFNDSLAGMALQSKSLMDSIRFNVGTLETREDNILKERTAEVRSSNRLVKGIIAVSLIVAILLIAYSIFTFNAEYRARRAATYRANEYQAELEKRVDELNRANEELVELRSLEKFTSTGRIARTIGHEVRNPLTTIDLAAEQLDNDDLSKDERRVLLDMIQRNSRRVNYLITDLLNATKFAELKYEKININELLNDTLLLASDRMQLNKLMIKKDFDNSIPAVQVDRSHMKIALLNIIVNAIESMSSEMGILSLETKKEQDGCVIRIADNGRGMTKETLAKIFDPFFTSKPHGTGLGLTNTQRIIFNHRGRINVWSEPGRGTVFTIWLPLSA